jgi:hypothetical protein
MNFTPQQKAWILLITIILMSGGGVFLTSLAGGSKLWFAVASGLITASSSVFHALSKPPTTDDTKPNP